MKTLLCFALIATALSPRLAASAEKPDKAELMALGEQFLDSLQDDNIVAFAQCWVSGTRMMDKIKRMQTVPKKMAIAWRQRLLSRDREIAAVFKPLREELGRLAGDLSRVSLESLSTDELDEWRYKDGRKEVKVNDVVMLLRTDADTVVRVRVNGAWKMGDEWYFSNSLFDLIDILRTKDGKREPTERQSLDDLIRKHEGGEATQRKSPPSLGPGQQ